MCRKNNFARRSVSALPAVLFVLLIFAVSLARAQTTVFTYQGRLTDTSTAANGTYDLEFKLYDAAGIQIGAAQVKEDVAVSNGIFTVQLDAALFAANAFDGGDRTLEIAVRRGTETGTFTVLTPRQPVTSTPYAIRALRAGEADNATNADNAANADTATIATDAQQLGGVAANQFVQTNSTAFIRNQTTQQPTADFNISGTGAANIFNANSQFNIGGNRAFTVLGDNTFAGTEAGRDNSGGGNSFFGYFAGRVNSGGNNNSFFGRSAGNANTIGGFNSFFGQFAGESNTTGTGNSFFGRGSGNLNQTGSFNTMMGYGANVSDTNLMYATALGSGAIVGTSDTIVLGKVAGSYNGNSRSADTVQIPGILTVAGDTTIGGALSGNTVNSETQFTIGGNRKLEIDSRSNILVGTLRPLYGGGEQTTGGANNTFLGISTGGGFNNPDDGIGFDTTGSNNTLIGANTSTGYPNLNYATAIGAGARVNDSNTIVLGRSAQGLDTVVAAGNVNIGGALQVRLLGDGPGGTLCRNNSTFQLSFCSSSIRYKTNVADFAFGLSLINKLRPVTFDWKVDGTPDVGFIAEEVNAAEPLLTIYNDKGQVEGIKYDRMSALFVNAFKEQQTQIEQQQKRLAEQQIVIDGLKKLVCLQNPNADVCK